MDDQIGARLKELRGASMTQGQLAASVNVRLATWGSEEKWQQSTLTRIEAGERPLRLREAVAVAETLDIALDELVPGYESPSYNRAIAELMKVARKAGALQKEIIDRVGELAELSGDESGEK